MIISLSLSLCVSLLSSHQVIDDDQRIRANGLRCCCCWWWFQWKKKIACCLIKLYKKLDVFWINNDGLIFSIWKYIFIILSNPHIQCAILNFRFFFTCMVVLVFRVLLYSEWTEFSNNRRQKKKSTQTRFGFSFSSSSSGYSMMMLSFQLFLFWFGYFSSMIWPVVIVV